MVFYCFLFFGLTHGRLHGGFCQVKTRVAHARLPAVSTDKSLDRGMTFNRSQS